MNGSIAPAPLFVSVRLIIVVAVEPGEKAGVCTVQFVTVSVLRVFSL